MAWPAARACASVIPTAATSGSTKSFDEDQTKQIRRGVVEGDDKLTALLALTREVATNRGSVDDATWRTALDAGWSEQQLLEAFADTVRTIFTNFFNHFVDTEQDVPEAPPL